MKRNLLFLIALLFSSLASAQYQPEQTSLNWSKPLAEKKKMTFNKFVGENEEGVFVTKTPLKKEIRGNQAFPVLEVYDENFNLTKSRELDIKEGRGKIIYENTVMLEGKLYLFYSLLYIWDQSITLMVQPLDAQTLQPTGAPNKAIATKIPGATTRDNSPILGLSILMTILTSSYPTSSRQEVIRCKKSIYTFWMDILVKDGGKK